jgi:hypothetical protein
MPRGGFPQPGANRIDFPIGFWVMIAGAGLWVAGLRMGISSLPNIQVPTWVGFSILFGILLVVGGYLLYQFLSP